MRRVSLWPAIAAVVVVQLALCVSAAATFPGRNGLLATTLGTDVGCTPHRSVFTFRFDGRAVRDMRQITCGFLEAHDMPRWAPNGRSLLYTDIGDPTDSRHYAHLYRIAPDGSNRRLIGRSGIDTYAWSPDGRMLASNGIYLGPLRNPTERVIALGHHPAWSPDGQSLVFVEDDPADDCSNLSIFDVATGNRKRVLVQGEKRGDWCGDYTRWPDWSPDGRKIVFSGTGTRSSESTANFDIYRIGIRGRSRHRLTRDKLGDDTPIWSPDGRWIAYDANRSLAFMHPDGSRKRKFPVSPYSLSWQRLPVRRR